MDSKESELPVFQGGTERFLQLLTNHNKSIYAYIFSLVPNYFDADDIMQETVTYMYREFDKFELGTSFLAWAFKIARYRVLSYLKRSKDRRIQFNDEILDLIEAESKEVLKEINFRLEALQHCRQKLANQDSQLLQMKYVEGVETKSIAERSGKSIHSVYRSIARIHEMLLKCIRRRLVEMGI